MHACVVHRLQDVWVARKPPGFAFVEFESDMDARVSTFQCLFRLLLSHTKHTKHTHTHTLSLSLPCATTLRMLCGSLMAVKSAVVVFVWRLLVAGAGAALAVAG